MRRGVEHAVRLPPLRVCLGEEATDAGARARLEHDRARVRRDDALRPRGLEDPRRSDEPGPQVAEVVGREAVAGRRLAVAADHDLPAVAVPHDREDGGQVRVAEREVQALPRPVPLQPRAEEAGVDRRGLVADAVRAVEPRVLL